MKGVVALDSFKGTLPAGEACRIAAEGLAEVLPGAEICCVPLADGGEGTAQALMSGLGGEWRTLDVAGPLAGQQVQAGFVWLPKRSEAVVEMARASGLPLVPPNARDPLRTTTRGTGELLAAASALKPERIWLAVGGSATVDGGVGAAAALGWRFLNAKGDELPPGGGALRELARIVPPPERVPLATIEVLCDVTNPLLGAHGAARMFAPQKGADADAVELLEEGLSRLAAVVQQDLGVVMDGPRGGAAGGLAAGAMAFFGAELVSGIDAVLEVTQLREFLRGADWVVTGEGCLDGPSLAGKVVSGVIREGKAAAVPVVVLAGDCALTPAEVQAAGLGAVETCRRPGMGEEEALARADSLLRAAAGRLGRRLAAGRGL